LGGRDALSADAPQYFQPSKMTAKSRTLRRVTRDTVFKTDLSVY